MELIKLTARNWCQHAKIEHEFKPGINGIMAQNGAGKSNFLDALRFATTGESINHGNKQDNLRWGERSGWVEVEYLHQGSPLRIRRNIHDAKVEVQLGTEDKVTGSGPTSKLLLDLFGTSPDSLLSNVFVPQGRIDEILLKKPQARLSEFQEVFGLGLVDDIHRALGTEIAAHRVDPTLEGQVQVMTSEVLESQKKITELQRTVTDLRPLIVELDQALALLRRAEEAATSTAALRQAGEALTRAIEQSENHEGQVIRARHAHDHFKAQTDPVLAQEPQAQQRLAALRQQATQWDETVRLREKAELLAKQVEQLRQRPGATVEPQVLAQMRDTLSSQSARVQLIEQALQGNRAPLPEEQQIQAAIQDFNSQIARYPVTAQPTELQIQLTHELTELQRHQGHFAQGVCPTCNQAVNGGPEAAAQRKAAIEQLSQRIRDEVSRATAQWSAGKLALEQQLGQAKTALQGYAEAARQTFQRQLNDAKIARDRQAQEVLDTERASNDLRAVTHELELAQRGLEGRATEPPDLAATQELESLLTQCAQARAELTKLDQTLKLAEQAWTIAKGAQKVREQEFTNLKQAQANLVSPAEAEVQVAKATVDRLSARRVELSEAERTLGVQEATHRHLERTLADARASFERQAKLARWVQIAERTRDVFHVSNLTMTLMRAYGLVINQRMDQHLRQWGAPFRLTLDENLAFRAQLAEGPEIDAQRLSGGQRIVAGIAFRLAIVDTFARQVGLLVLDEPTNYLDENNIVNLTQALMRLKTAVGQQRRQILVVTHEQRLVGAFDHIINL